MGTSRLALDQVIKSQYKHSEDLAYIFKRNEDEVDAEMRTEIVKQIKFVAANLSMQEEPISISSQLSDDQFELSMRCKDMERGMTEAELMEESFMLREGSKHSHTLASFVGKHDSGESDFMTMGDFETGSTSSSMRTHSTSALNDTGRPSWTPINSSSPFVKMFVKNAYLEKSKKKSTSIVCCRSETVVDCSAEEALAWQWDYASYDRMRTSEREKNPGRLVWSKRSANDWVIATLKKGPPTFQHREFVARQIWYIEREGVFVIACESCDDVVDWCNQHKCVRGFTRTLIKCERLKPLALTPSNERCKINIYSIIDAGAPVPNWIKNNFLVVNSMNVLITLRGQLFDAERHDAMILELCMQKLTNYSEQVYSLEEEELIARLIDSGKHDADKIVWKEIKSPETSFEVEAAYNDDSDKACTKCSVVVHALKESCAAYDWYVMSNRRVKEDYAASPFSEKHDIFENEHKHIFRYQKSLVANQIGSVRPREWVVRRLWKIYDEDPDVIYVVTHSIDHPRFPKRQNSVRCEWAQVTSFKSIRDKNGNNTGNTLIKSFTKGDIKISTKSIGKRLAGKERRAMSTMVSNQI